MNRLTCSERAQALQLLCEGMSIRAVTRIWLRSERPTAERNNLNIRMHSLRLTNAFSKKMENHVHAMALHFHYYNFVRMHKTLKVTPAMAAGVTDRPWEVADMVGVLEAQVGLTK